MLDEAHRICLSLSYARLLTPKRCPPEELASGSTSKDVSFFSSFLLSSTCTRPLQKIAGFLGGAGAGGSSLTVANSLARLSAGHRGKQG